MFVPKIYRSILGEELEEYVYNEVSNMFYWEVLLMIDYNNHHDDDDYDGGLSFINRIQAKVGWFHTEWNVEALRKNVLSQKDYIHVISSMLDYEVCSMYGIQDIKNGF